MQIYYRRGQRLNCSIRVLSPVGYAPDPMTVLVTDTNGKPLANVPVTFAVSAGPGNVDNTAPVPTGANGEAIANFVPTGISSGGNNFQTSTVTASSTYGSVNFTETTFVNQFGVGGFPEILLNTPGASRTINVTAGTPLVGGVQAQILSSSIQCAGCPIPGIGISFLSPDNPTNSPTGTQAPIMCQGSSLSDQNGNASCTVVATTCQTESVGVIILIGNLIAQQATANISGGSAATLSIVSGNKQTGQSGQALPKPMLVQVVDACGNPVVGLPVTWKVTAGTATLTQTNLVTSPSGQASSSLTFGQTAGTITVQVSLGNGSTVSFTLTNQVLATSLKLTSGGSQTAATTGQAFAQPLVFTLTDTNGHPVVGTTVSFAVTTGSATVSPASIATDASGNAQTTVTAGSTAGAIVVTATAAGLSATASLASQPPGPSLTAARFPERGQLHGRVSRRSAGWHW